MPLPAPPLRTNVGTWAVPICSLPAVAHFLHDVLSNEPWDPHFWGQALETTYFDTPGRALRSARQKGERYLTLRLRCYDAPDQPALYAISAKTESEKWREEVSEADAQAVLDRPGRLADFLPAPLLARFLALAEGELQAAVAVCCRRYAVEGDEDRYTLDVGVETDLGKCLPHAVLERKCAGPAPGVAGAAGPPPLAPGPPAALRALRLRPIKLSKFLWATRP
jgi:hypothetical protein